MTTPRETGAYGRLEERLAAAFTQDAVYIDLEEVTGSPVACASFNYTSANWRVHPPADGVDTDPTLRALLAYYLEQNPYSRKYFPHDLESADRDVTENRSFRYSVFLPTTGQPRGATGVGPRDAKAAVTAGFDRAILLLHGLNERSWRKYLPWAHRLVERTGIPVILFPIAFHMNRAPRAWATPREMMGVSKERKRLFPGLRSSTFVNAALSHRVQFAPHRFITSGLQSYYDLVDLVREISAGGHPLFREESRVDVFGYSIGASLAQLLVMTDPEGLFRASRTFLFCGGALMDQASPVSRAIIDSQAHRGLYDYLARLVTDPEQAIPAGTEVPASGSAEPTRSIRPLTADLPEVEVLTSLLFADVRRQLREEKAREAADRMRILGLEKDAVFYPEGLRASWRDSRGTRLLDVHTLDAAAAYTHEQPFPFAAQEADEVDGLFDRVFDAAAAHLGRNRADSRRSVQELTESA
jgi:pimeloyl-ACP methyl ester carboxylesterase